MTYEAIAQLCQILAMGIFGSVMAGFLIHVFRPANKAHFETASRMVVGNETIAGDVSDGD
jgi:cbb3-type cytochrome oxidase subunit 3